VSDFDDELRDTTEVESRMKQSLNALPPESGAVSTEPPPSRVLLEISYHSKKTKIALEFSSAKIFVGRGSTNDPVEIDLNIFDALQFGVSRRHAAFSRRDTGIFVEDLSSKNGTRINGFSLKPNKAYLLRNGDEIEFGQFRTTIRFVY
jgi:hypothetical protein